MYDCIVIGGGPAGLFAAYNAAINGNNVLLLEKNDRCGRKLDITGKGRCNLTNACTREEFLNNVIANPRFMMSAISRFSQEDTIAFFESLGYRHDREQHVYIPVAPTEERVALFAHQAFSMAFLSHVLDIPYPLYATHFDTCHSGMTVIEFREQDGVVIPKMLQL
ncbi:MAG: NAD(P)/FAD-dependent oxidoreductase, partial [Clostridia bacterium]|nr:NAD(P)/FAD-dependent oxidoreductase [Clostridia bacterium]